MLQISSKNLLLETILSERILSGNRLTSVDQVISDFDNVVFHVSTGESKEELIISISIKCFSDLVKYGAKEVLEREYGEFILNPVEIGYDFSIKINTENIKNNSSISLEDKVALIDKIALLKRNAMAAPFENAFKEFDELEAKATQQSLDLNVPEDSRANIAAIHYRDEESIYIKPSHDRVTVIFSTIFQDETDRVFGKVFLQEFVDARKQAIQNAPQVLYSNREPPLEIRHLIKKPINLNDRDMGYVTFVLFPRHLTIQKRENAISHIMLFRDYFHYHIKCSKVYMQSRMRHRVSEFLKVLNRAKPEVAERELKTASGRRFDIRR